MKTKTRKETDSCVPPKKLEASLSSEKFYNKVKERSTVNSVQKNISAVAKITPEKVTKGIPISIAKRIPFQKSFSRVSSRDKHQVEDREIARTRFPTPIKNNTESILMRSHISNTPSKTLLNLTSKIKPKSTHYPPPSPPCVKKEDINIDFSRTIKVDPSHLRTLPKNTSTSPPPTRKTPIKNSRYDNYNTPKHYGSVNKEKRLETEVSNISCSSKNSHFSNSIQSKTPERSKISQNSLKLNLQDLINIDNIFSQISLTKKLLTDFGRFVVIQNYLSYNYCFILQDLNGLMCDIQFREEMRKYYLKELIFFIYIYLFLLKNQMEIEQLEKQLYNNKEIQDFLDIKKETSNVLTRILSNIQNVFVLRTDIFIDLTSIYYHTQPLYTKLKMLISKRKSKSSLVSSNGTVIYEENIAQITKYLYITEHALEQLFEINPSYDKLRAGLFTSLNAIANRKDVLSILEFNYHFKVLGIVFDKKGIFSFDKTAILKLLDGISKYSLGSSELDQGSIIEPFLPILIEKGKKFSLVIDLDETLIHYPDDKLAELEKKFTTKISKAELKKCLDYKLRPFTCEFLVQLKPFYEIIIFTAASQNYADLVIDSFDSEKLINHRLYRQHMTEFNGRLVKDISKLGRDIRKIIIVDNTPENFILQSKNGIYIKSWTDDLYDKSLSLLLPILLNIAKSVPNDVREILEEIKRMLQK